MSEAIYVARDLSRWPPKCIKVAGMEMFGPFPSVEAARKWIRKDMLEDYQPEDVPRDVTFWRDEDYSGVYTLLRVIGSVRPVPVIRVSCELQTVKGVPHEVRRGSDAR